VSGWIQIGDVDQIDDLIRTLTKLNEGNIDVARRGVQTMDQSRDLAQQLGITIDDVLSRRRGEALNAEQTQAYIDAWGGANKELDRLAEAWKLDPTNPRLDADLRQQLGVANALTEHIFGVRAEAGRALNMWRTVAQEVRVKIGRVAKETEALAAGQGLDDVPTARLVEMLDSMREPAQKATFFRSLLRAGPDALVEAWVNGLLTNPVTHAVNFMSNTVVGTLGISERALAAGGRSLANKIGLGIGEGVVKGEASAMIHALTNGMLDAIRLGGKALRTGESGFFKQAPEQFALFGKGGGPAPTGTTKIDLPRRGITAEAFGLSGVPGRAVDMIGEFVRIPGRFLIAGDEFFKTLNYRMELHAQSWRQAVREFGTDEKLIADRMQQIMASPPGKARDAAEQFANYQTFTNALKEKDFITAIGRTTLSFANEHPLARVIVPFVRTPTNIFKYTLERTPLANLALKQVRDDILAGGVRRDLALAKTAMGGMIMGTGAYLASAGFITGGGPLDRKLRNIKRQTGWQPYSILVGDTYYSYKRLEPIGALFGVTADFQEIVGQLPEWEAESIAAGLVMSFKENFINTTYMQGMSNAMEAINSPDRKWGNYFKRLSGSLVPAGVAQVERLMDPAIREARDSLDFIRSRVPGYSQDLPPRRNLWGEPIILEGGFGPDIISPFYSSTVKNDPVSEEIVRQSVSIGMPPDFIGGFRPPKGSLAKDRPIQGVRMTSQEYDLFVRLAGNELKIGGLGAKDRLERDIQTFKYKTASPGPDGGKALIIRTIINQYREAAKLEVLRQNDELRELVEGARRDRMEALRPTGQLSVIP